MPKNFMQFLLRPRVKVNIPYLVGFGLSLGLQIFGLCRNCSILSSFFDIYLTHGHNVNKFTGLQLQLPT